MEIRLTLPEGRSMREVLSELVEHARQEREWCVKRGRSSRAEAFERFAVAVEAIPAPAPPCQHMRCEAGSRRCLDCGVHVPY